MPRFFPLLLAGIAVFAQDSPRGAVTGTVVDEASGTPLPGARLEIGRLTELKSAAFATADDNGVFRLSGLTPARYWIGAQKDGYIQVHGYRLDGPTVDVPAVGDAPRVTVRLALGASIEGVLVSEVGDPIAGAKVDAVESYLDPAVTDAQGRFRIAGLPAGEYRLRARLNDAARLTHVRPDPVTGRRSGPPLLASHPDTFRMGKGMPVTGLRFSLPFRPLISVRGSVPDCPNCEVELRLADGLAGFGVPRRPLQDGAFHFDSLTRGTYQLILYRQPGFEATPFVTALEVRDEDIRDLSIVVKSGGRLTGRIIGPRNPAASVWLTPAGAYTPATAPVAADGTFAFEGLAPGQWRLSLSGRAPSTPFTMLAIRQQGRRVQTITIVDGDNPPVEIETAEMFWVSGIVTDAAGRPVENAIVAFENAAERRMNQAGKDGVFKIGLPAGEFRVTAWRSMPAPGPLPLCPLAQPVRITRELAGLNLVVCRE